MASQITRSPVPGWSGGRSWRSQARFAGFESRDPHRAARRTEDGRMIIVNGVDITAWVQGFTMYLTGMFVGYYLWGRR